MTSSELPAEVPASGSDTPPPAQRRWPSQQQLLGLVGAFLLGAFLCGGAGLAIGAIAGNFHGNHGPRHNGPDFDRRDDHGPRRKDVRPPRRPGLFPPTLAPGAPAAPATPAPTTSPS